MTLTYKPDLHMVEMSRLANSQISTLWVSSFEIYRPDRQTDTQTIALHGH